MTAQCMVALKRVSTLAPKPSLRANCLIAVKSVWWNATVAKKIGDPNGSL